LDGHMSDRAAPLVAVPDVVGLPFRIGRDVATEAGVALANPDPDGPPIGGLAWPGLFYITSQDPAPGTVLHEWDSVRVQIVKHGNSPDRAPAAPHPLPPEDAAHAHPEHDVIIDRTED
jgi:hypothetical protein